MFRCWISVIHISRGKVVCIVGCTAAGAQANNSYAVTFLFCAEGMYVTGTSNQPLTLE